jgi:putative heme-binding domain-containing protein
MSIVMLADGRVLNGLVMSKDAQTLVLRTATEQVTLTLDDVELIKESPLSAMPDGLLQNLEADQIRDLIAYLQHPVQVPLPDDVRD